MRKNECTGLENSEGDLQLSVLKELVEEMIVLSFLAQFRIIFIAEYSRSLNINN